MWLLTTFAALAAASALYFLAGDARRKYRLDALVLMLLGTFVMVLVDKGIGFMQEGGAILEAETTGLVPNSVVLGLLMLVPILAIWAGLVLAQGKTDPAASQVG